MADKFVRVEAVVQTAEGEVKAFAGVVARFIVAHPRLSACLALALGFAIGKLV
jgi:hypothetical protein